MIPLWAVICIVIAVVLVTEGVREALGGNGNVPPRGWEWRD